jgi:hypothetical protein
MYGQRCNFIHARPVPRIQSVVGDCSFQEIRAEGRLLSRLLVLLSDS